MPWETVADRALSAELESRVRRSTSPYRDVIRAKIVLLAAQGLRNDEIAARLDTRRELVSKWRKCFFEQGLGGLADAPDVVAVKALTCGLPAALGVRCHDRTCPTFATRRSAAGWSPTSAARPSGGGPQTTWSARVPTAARSSPAILTSPPRPTACSTCTSGRTTAARCATRRPSSRRAAAATPTLPPPARCASSTNTTAGPGWPPGTSTTPASSPVARPAAGTVPFDRLALTNRPPSPSSGSSPAPTSISSSNAWPAIRPRPAAWPKHATELPIQSS